MRGKLLPGRTRGPGSERGGQRACLGGPPAAPPVAPPLRRGITVPMAEAGAAILPTPVSDAAGGERNLPLVRGRHARSTGCRLELGRPARESPTGPRAGGAFLA